MTDHHDREKLVKVLNLLGSDKPGEVLAAAQTASKLMEKFGLSWERIFGQKKFDESKRYKNIRLMLWYLHSTVVAEMPHWKSIRNLERIFELNGDLEPDEHRALTLHFLRMKRVIGMYMWKPHVANRRLK